MHRITLLILSILLALSAPCQSKKERKKNKIRSTTEWETTLVDGKNSTYKTSYEEFDKSGRSIVKITYAPNGSITAKSTTVYDRNGNKTSETETDVEKKRDLKRTFKYNALNDKTEEAEYSMAGLLLKKVLFSYDASGNKVTETEVDAAGKMINKTVYTYNTRNLKTGKTTAPGSKKWEQSKKWDYVYY